MATIKQTVEVEIEPTPNALARLIWEMNAEEQLDFLYALSEVAPFSNIRTQMQAIRDEIKISGLEDDIQVKHFIADLYKYICEED